ncbi:MAG TPA: Rho termination factor N-terminal domain-containing protein, partial [Deltaproteobacteria bacterium]|nr:Rho termination factor N-terminal domain-containing protein [Deltaproteobacteria bacterium]
MHLEDLKKVEPKELLETANALEIEGSATMTRQELIFAILQAQS